tara:strand:- start:283 stop:528 length:246 start_codon:yes stop_codon:yes gene_type:complete
MGFSAGPQEHDKIKLARMIGMGLAPSVPGLGGLGGAIGGAMAENITRKVLDKAPLSDTIKSVARGALQGPGAILVPPMGGR